MRKRHAVFLIFLTLIAVSSAPLVMNYTGMCWAEKRWLTDEEKISAVLGFLNSREEIPVSNPGVNGSTFYKQIPYPSVSEIRNAYPNCCSIKAGYMSDHSAFRRIDGVASGSIVSVKYPRKYISGTEVRTEIVDDAFEVGNCGHVGD